MPGVTAYFGTTDVAEPMPGETVVVSAAAGAVGSVVGRIADLAGCRVVGVAGVDEKIEWIESAGFDEGINYTGADVSARLREACPDGVDVYFVNVGGPITDAVWPLLNVRARVAVCGQISQYDETEVPTGPGSSGSSSRPAPAWGGCSSATTRTAGGMPSAGSPGGSPTARSSTARTSSRPGERSRRLPRPLRGDEDREATRAGRRALGVTGRTDPASVATPGPRPPATGTTPLSPRRRA
jgi:hypothetical protein